MSKRILSVLLALVIAVAALPSLALGSSVQPRYDDENVRTIYPWKDVLLINETFGVDDFVVITADYSSVKADSVTPTSFSEAGQKTVTVTYGGQDYEVEIWVGDDSEEPLYFYSASAAQNFIYLGQEIKLTDCKLFGYKNNGDRFTVTEDIDYYPKVINSYDSDDDTVNITFEYKGITYLSEFYAIDTANGGGRIDIDCDPVIVVNQPVSLSYVNEIIVYLNSGHTFSYYGVSGANVITEPTVFTQTGEQLLTVSYLGAVSQIPVYVLDGTDSYWKTVVESKPDKYYYFKGETIDTAGLELSVYNNKGEYETVTSGFACSPSVAEGSDVTDITVTYGDKSIDFEVYVIDLSQTGRYTVDVYGKDMYTVGQSLDLSQLNFDFCERIYEPGMSWLTSLYKIEDISEITCDTTSFDSLGAAKVNFTWKGLNFSKTVDVVDGTATPYSLEIYNNPDKKLYYVGDSVDLSGMTLRVRKNNGTYETVSEGFSCEPKTLTKAGGQQVTVTYPGTSAVCEFYVYAADKSKGEYNIDRAYCSDTFYNIGDTFDKSNITLDVSCNDYYTYVYSGVECPDTVFTEAGWQSVPVSYAGATSSVEVYVGDGTDAPYKIEVWNSPDKLYYYSGDTLDTKGLMLGVYKNDGTYDSVESGFTCSPEALIGNGWQSINVTYAGFTKTFSVYVNDRSQGDYTVETEPNYYSNGCPLVNKYASLWLYASIFVGGTFIDSAGCQLELAPYSTAGYKKVDVNIRGLPAKADVYVGDGSKTPFMISAEAVNYFEYLRVEPGALIGPEDLCVYAFLNNGEVRRVSYLADFGNAPAETGLQSITVSYGGVSCQTFVMVLKPGDIDSDEFDVSDNTISGISCGTTLSSFSSGIYTDSKYKLFNGSIEVTDMSAKVGTGMVLRVYDDDDKLISERTLAVKGDADGDGKVTTTDARLTLRKAAKLDSFTAEQTVATDLDGVEGISTTDARILLRVAAKLDSLD